MKLTPIQTLVVVDNTQTSETIAIDCRIHIIQRILTHPKILPI
ncbi:MAG: hypothetical protein ACRCSB_05045 [Bacteroidales bacterium]